MSQTTQILDCPCCGNFPRCNGVNLGVDRAMTCVISGAGSCSDGTYAALGNVNQGFTQGVAVSTIDAGGVCRDAASGLGGTDIGFVCELSGWSCNLGPFVLISLTEDPFSITFHVDRTALDFSTPPPSGTFVVTFTVDPPP